MPCFDVFAIISVIAIFADDGLPRFRR